VISLLARCFLAHRGRKPKGNEETLEPPRCLFKVGLPANLGPRLDLRLGGVGGALPRLPLCTQTPHACSFTGDLPAVRRCLLEGEDVRQLSSMVNQAKQHVEGVTPLYLVGRWSAWLAQGPCLLGRG
jgi:hypothetical protein